MKKFKQVALMLPLIALIAISSCKTEKTPGVVITDPKALDAILDNYVEKDIYSFLYARLEDKNGAVLYEHGAVNQELLPGITVDRQSWMRIWSMSKIVTISIVMDLVEDGILNLNDPVTKYIPEFANLKVAVNNEGVSLSQVKDPDNLCPFQLVPMDSVMTIYHLINHQAGFYYANINISCLDTLLSSINLPKSENSKDLVNRLAVMPLIQQPGEKYYYGTNTTILGIVAERATQKSLKQLVEDRLTRPLNITGLKYSLPEGVNLVSSVTGLDGALRKAKPGELDIFGPDVPDYDPGHELYLGGEGMLATADGYADFLRMLLKGGELNGQKFLEISSIENITAPHTLTDSPWGYNGFNLWITGDSLRVKGWGDAGLWTGGGYEGTKFWIDPKRDFVGVIMTQMYWIPGGGWNMYNDFRGALYKQIFEAENKK